VVTRAAVVTQATIDRAIRVAEKHGLAVTGIECLPGGTVRVLTAAAGEAGGHNHGQVDDYWDRRNARQGPP